MTDDQTKYVDASTPKPDSSQRRCGAFNGGMRRLIRHACPYHSDAAWREVRDGDPVAWGRAVAFDEQITADRGAYLHRSLIPLRLVDLGQEEPDLFADECAGYCGI